MFRVQGIQTIVMYSKSRQEATHGGTGYVFRSSRCKCTCKPSTPMLCSLQQHDARHPATQRVSLSSPSSVRQIAAVANLPPATLRQFGTVDPKYRGQSTSFSGCPDRPMLRCGGTVPQLATTTHDGETRPFAHRRQGRNIPHSQFLLS